MELTEQAIEFKQDDGGRSKYFRGKEAGDCVTRAIAIATGKSYKEVYNDLFKLANKSPRNGVHRSVYDKYLRGLGWTWVPTMEIGSGCQVHLRACELPDGKIIVRLSRHVAAVINRVLHDTYDCSRDGTRCVYGYYMEPQ